MDVVVLAVRQELDLDAFLCYIGEIETRGMHFISATDHAMAVLFGFRENATLRSDLNHQSTFEWNSIPPNSLVLLSCETFEALIPSVFPDFAPSSLFGFNLTSQKPIFLTDFTDFATQNQLKSYKNPLIPPVIPFYAKISEKNCDFNPAFDKKYANFSFLSRNLEKFTEVVSGCENALDNLKVNLERISRLIRELPPSLPLSTRLSSLSTRVSTLNRSLPSTSSLFHLQKHKKGYLFIINFSQTPQSISIRMETKGNGTSDSDVFELFPGGHMLDFTSYAEEIVWAAIVQREEVVSEVVKWEEQEVQREKREWQQWYPTLDSASCSISSFITPEEREVYEVIKSLLPELAQTDEQFLRFVKIVKRVGNVQEIDAIINEMMEEEGGSRLERVENEEGSGLEEVEDEEGSELEGVEEGVWV